jgi:hypothetical protein
LQKEWDERVVNVFLAELQMVSHDRHEVYPACFVKGPQADVVVHVEVRLFEGLYWVLIL